MTDPQNQNSSLATHVREHVTHDEPPFLLSPETSIALGRRTLVRRRARRGAVGVLVAAAAVAAVPLLPLGGSSGRHDVGIDPATTHALEHYDAKGMPVLIDQHVRAALGDGLEGLGQAEFTAFDAKVAFTPEPLPGDVWVGLIATYSDHSQLPPEQLAELQRRVGETIQRHGGVVPARRGNFVQLTRRV